MDLRSFSHVLTSEMNICKKPKMDGIGDIG
jgi:hypothetical protein